MEMELFDFEQWLFLETWKISPRPSLAEVFCLSKHWTGPKWKTSVVKTAPGAPTCTKDTNSCFMCESHKKKKKTLQDEELNIRRLLPIPESTSLSKMDVFTEEHLQNSAQLLNQSLLREKVLRFGQESIWTRLSIMGGSGSPFPIRFDSAAHTGCVAVAGVWNWIHF